MQYVKGYHFLCKLYERVTFSVENAFKRVRVLRGGGRGGVPHIKLSCSPGSKRFVTHSFTLSSIGINELAFNN